MALLQLNMLKIRTGEFICAKHDIMKGQKKKAAPTGESLDAMADH